MKSEEIVGVSAVDGIGQGIVGLGVRAPAGGRGRQAEHCVLELVHDGLDEALFEVQKLCG